MISGALRSVVFDSELLVLGWVVSVLSSLRVVGFRNAMDRLMRPTVSVCNAVGSCFSFESMEGHECLFYF